MQIREYQQWLEAWDRTRGWERVAMSHTLIHATEELGEVARLILQWEGYKDLPDLERWRGELEEELSDTIIFLFKLAYQAGIDIESALTRGQAKAEARHMDPVVSAAELVHYLQRQRALLDAISEPSAE
jgi:NTP pyrophosphatase (non-canonical NTP hydrolase)